VSVPALVEVVAVGSSVVGAVDWLSVGSRSGPHHQQSRPERAIRVMSAVRIFGAELVILSDSVVEEGYSSGGRGNRRT
jgi:hypothetical protein